MNEEQIKSFEDAAEPLIKWLNENKNPHTYVMISNYGAEMVEGIYQFTNLEHIND